ncbi:CHAT domain-containing protein [Xylaria acuta]|nr:CHAT domain-containing protein [Xylaria acuta]
MAPNPNESRVKTTTPSWLSNLGNLLAWRYERTGVMRDLQSAILRAEEALDATPCDHPKQPGRLRNLGNWLGRRYELTGAMDDLESAILQSLDITPRGHPDRASYFNSLGVMLARKHSHKGDSADISLAVCHVEKALGLTPADSPERINWLSNLATIVAWKFQRTGFPDDLDDAIHRAYQTLAAMPTNHPYQALALITQGDLLYCRYNQPHATGFQKWRDYNDCVLHYQEAWNSHTGPPAVRIRAAQKAAQILLRLGKCEESNALLHDAIQLIPSISPHNLKQRDRQYILGEFAGLATLAASAALGAGEEPVRALQLLEQGRAVGAGQRLGIRATLTTLRIRKLPGFETFLLPPTVEELKSAASSGPVVVINTSPFRCDAVLIRTDSIRSIPLSHLKYKAMRHMVDLFKTAREMNRPFHDQKDMLEILEWLWDKVTSPVLNALGFREPPGEGDVWPHVWWIPTGLLTMLPIHAAGRHMSALPETVIDRVISSYSPSVRALLYTRRQTIEYGRIRGEACLTSMIITPGCSSLPTAEEEIASVEALLPALGVGPTRTLRNPRKAEVIDGLKSCDIFHFAGHGVSNQVDPSKSSLLLHDWKENPLTVESIMDSNLDGNTPFLAYLSACSTGAILDESCQLAGFRHAVGSLWDLFNKYPAAAATQFYKALREGDAIDDNAVACAVHATARHIREITRGPEDAVLGAGDPFAWAAYIHIGPALREVI